MRITSLLSVSTLFVLGTAACGSTPATTTGSGGSASTSSSTSSAGTGGATTSTSTGTGGGSDPSKLDPPPTGQGFQFATKDIQVPTGTEEQDCYFFKVSELAKSGGLDPAKAVNLHQVQVAQKPGSHHMNIFRVKSIVQLGPPGSMLKDGTMAGGAVQTGTNNMGQCFKSSNWADWPLVANSQINGEVDWTYPAGVANKLLPDEWIMLQTHYVNAATQKTDYGHVRVNFWQIPDAQVTAEMGTIFATKQSIRICKSNPTPTFEGSCQINSPNPVHVIGANGHFHSRGKVFDIFSWDGMSITTPPAAAKFYESTDWQDPPMKHSPELDLIIPANGGIWYSGTYQWTPPPAPLTCADVDAWDKLKYNTPDAQLDCCYTFGPIVDKNEHCNAFAYYYPKQDNVNCQ